jgi:hypothetical protein
MLDCLQQYHPNPYIGPKQCLCIQNRPPTDDVKMRPILCACGSARQRRVIPGDRRKCWAPVVVGPRWGTSREVGEGGEEHGSSGLNAVGTTQDSSPVAGEARLKTSPTVGKARHGSRRPPAAGEVREGSRHPSVSLEGGLLAAARAPSGYDSPPVCELLPAASSRWRPQWAAGPRWCCVSSVSYLWWRLYPLWVTQ